MIPHASAALLEKLAGLRTDLIDLAYTLERTGRMDAADVAIQVSARVDQICAEVAPPDLQPARPRPRSS